MTILRTKGGKTLDGIVDIMTLRGIKMGTRENDNQRKRFVFMETELKGEGETFHLAKLVQLC